AREWPRGPGARSQSSRSSRRWGAAYHGGGGGDIGGNSVSQAGVYNFAKLISGFIVVNLQNDACRLVILISGRRSNMQTIVDTLVRDSLPAQVCAVISNRADAAGLDWAAGRGLTTHVVPHRVFDSRQEFDAALAEVIDQYQPHYVLLAGFMRVLTPGFVERYEGRLINIHPSLLPS